MTKKWTVLRVFTFVIVALLALLAITVIVGLIWHSAAQGKTRAERTQIDPKAGVDELFKVPAGGIQQWFHARGVNRNDPVLLYLHGGPGTPMIPFESMFQGSMEKHFIVVNWDQRCAGKTYFANPDLDCAKTANFKQMVKDAVDVVDLLKRRYGKDRIIVLGHSWGSILGLGLIQARPNDIAAYVGTGQVVDIEQNEALGYKATLDEARRLKNADAVRELEGLAPYPDPDGFSAGKKIDVLRKWEQRFGFAISRRYPGDIDNVMFPIALRSPEYSLKEVSFFLKDLDALMPQLMRDVDAFKAADLGSDYNVPMFLFLGRYDWQTPSVLAAQWETTITAPVNKTLWFENSAHSPMIDEPDAYTKALVQFVKPLAVKSEEKR